MGLFKNKNPQKTKHLKNCSQELRRNAAYVISAIKQFGVEELDYVDDSLKKNANFMLKLIEENPNAASKIPESSVYHTDDHTDEFEVSAHNMALMSYKTNPEVYKYLKMEEALFVRSFELGGTGVFVGKFKYIPVYHPTHIDGIEDPKYREEGLKAREEIKEMMDKLRPDVKQLAEKREEKNTVTR